MTSSIDQNDITKIQGNWNYPTSVRFGAGAIKELAAICKKHAMHCPLIVTDEGLAAFKFVAEMKADLAQQGVAADLFSRVKPNPTGKNVADGVTVYREKNHDGVIALGGGSGLDAGKAVALMAGQDRPIWDFEDIGDNWLRVKPEGIAPVIAIPTTSGTGSEVGRASVILDEDNHQKKIIFHPRMLPLAVVADPELTRGLPPHVTAATGMDAFTHCLEAFCASGYHPMADGIALEGMRLVKEWLVEAFSNGDNLVARSHMMCASSMGATAFQKGLGASHALAHPLGALYDKHHGLLNAILLPYVVIRNREAVENRLSYVAQCWGLPQADFDSFLQWLLALRKALNIPHTLADIQLTSDQSDRLGKLAVKDPSASGNPVPLSGNDYALLFEKAVSGDLG